MPVDELSTVDISALQRRTLAVLVSTQVLGGLGLASGATVGGLLAEDMLGSTALAGLPSALFTLGGAVSAFLVGRLSQQKGRRVGLSAGYGARAIGALGVVAGARLETVPLLVTGMIVYGAGTATSLQARYAGADLAATRHRGRAISTVLVATSLGAIAGPNLVDVTGDGADRIGLPTLTGPFVLSAIAYLVASLVLTVFLRPDPLLVARSGAGLERTPAAPTASTTPVTAPLHPGSLRLGAAALIIAQVVMVSIMTMTPIHMRDHGHSLAATGLVISIHVGCMYLPSLVTGIFVDRYGRRHAVGVAASLLLAAGVIAALAPVHSFAVLALALGLLGLGWNLGLIGGTSMVIDAVPVDRRAKVQGTVDLAVSLAGAAGGITSGIVVAGAGYATMSIVGGAISLAMLPALLATARKQAPPGA